VILVIVGFLALALVEIPSLARQKKRRDLIIVASMLGVSLTLSLLLAAGVKLPSPMHLLHSFLESIGLIYH